MKGTLNPANAPKETTCVVHVCGVPYVLVDAGERAANVLSRGYVVKSWQQQMVCLRYAHAGIAECVSAAIAVFIVFSNDIIVLGTRIEGGSLTVSQAQETS